MKNFARRIAVVIGAAALSAGLLGVTAMPAHADVDNQSQVQNQTWSRAVGGSGVVYAARDSSWPTG